MATAGFLLVTADGVDIEGESTVTMGGEVEGYIEIVEMNHDLRYSAEALRGDSTTRRHSPMRILARVDAATPMLYKALCNNEHCVVKIRFFRPDISGTGQTTEFFEILLEGGRVSGVKWILPNRLEPATSSLPDLVEYSFTYSSISWTHLDTNRGHRDTWVAH